MGGVSILTGAECQPDSDDASMVASMGEALRQMGRTTEDVVLAREIREAVGVLLSLSDKIDAYARSRP